MKAALYIRVSTDEQAREGFSLDAQERALRAFCASQGWSVSGVYRDEGWSAKSLDRPAMQHLLDDSRRGSFDVVLVWRVDRLSRRQRDVLHVIEDVFDPASVGFRSITESFDTSTPAGKAMVGMLAVFAQLERETMVERVRAGTRERVERGLWSGIPPYGTRYAGDGRLEADPDTITHLRRIFELAADGVSLGDIVRALVADGAPAPLGRPAWSRSHHTLSSIVRNRAYIGERRTRRGWIRSGHAPIIDPAAFRRANAALDDRTHHRYGPVAQHLLTGILRCPVCGSAMAWHNQAARYSARRSRDYHYYTCTKRPTACMRLPAEWAEEMVVSEFLQYEIPPVSATDDASPDSSQRMAEIDAALSRLVDAVQQDVLPLDLVRRRISALQSERASISESARPRPSSDAPLWADMREAWSDLTLSERRSAMLAVASGVVLDKTGEIRILWR